MIEITATEAKKLNEMGVPYKENGISKTYHKRHYYLCESKNNMNLLKSLRKRK